MWKSILNSLLEGLAMTDPIGATYYMASKREAELQAGPTQNQVSSEPPTRPINRSAWVRKEVSL